MSGTLTWPKPIIDQTDLDTEMENNNDGKTKRSLLSDRTRTHLMNLRHVYQQEHDLDDAEFQNYFIDILPAHWTVCSISLDITLQEMYVAQYRAGEPPLVVKLPLNRADERRRRRHPGGANCGITYEQAFTEFEDIIQHSDETIQSNKATLLKKEIEDWWITRSLLDTRMKKLLEQMERSWIGGFKVSQGTMKKRPYI
jgi:separase